MTYREITMNNTITWEYAQNFSENEKRWAELETAINDIVRVFTKNTMLQFMLMSQFLDILDMQVAIIKGDRSEFLYGKAKQVVEETINLESTGNSLKEAFLEAKKMASEEAITIKNQSSKTGKK